VQDNSLKKVDLSGGSPFTVATLGTSRVHGATWTDGGDIYFSWPDSGGGLYRVSDQGGDPQAISVPASASGEVEHATPSALPGDDGILYVSWPAEGRDENAWVAVLDPADGTSHRLTPGIQPYYSETGHLVYALADGSIMARSFDPSSFELGDEAVRIAEGVVTHDYSDTEYAVSRSGAIVVRPGSDRNRGLTRVTLSGEPTPLMETNLEVANPRFSPDGRRVVYSRARDLVGSGVDLWILDLESGLETRFTTESDFNISPVWNRDGTQVRYTSSQSDFAIRDIFTRPADLSAPPTRFGTEGGFLGKPSSSGEPIPYSVWANDGQADIWVMDGDGTNGREFIATQFLEAFPSISPNGEWIAYSSTVSGEWEVYVQPFPDGGGQALVSRGSGTEPLWASDNALVYVTLAGTLVHVTIDVTNGRLRAQDHRTVTDNVISGQGTHNFDVHPDGQSVLVISGTTSPRLYLQLNRLQQLGAGN